jgi:signal transduction histidine kinase/CheY-like chemotaxis protein
MIRLLLALLWRGWALPVLLLGMACSAGAEPAGLDLAAEPDRLELRDHLMMLSDGGAELQPLQALAAQAWYPATERSLHPGLTTAAFWLRAEVYNKGPDEVRRWLSLRSPRLEHAHLYRIGPHGLSGPVKAGVAYPTPTPMSGGRDAVFEISLMPGERAQLLLRVQSRTAIGLNPELWQPQAYLEHEELTDLLYLAPIGWMLGLVLYLVANTLALGNRTLFLFALLILMGTFYDFSFHGYLRRYAMPEGGDLAARLPNAIAMLSNAVLAIYIEKSMDMTSRRFWGKCFTFFGIAFACLGIMSLLGDLRQSIIASTLMLVVFYLSWPFSLLKCWVEGSIYIRIFVISLILLWIFTLIRVFSFLGYFQLSSWSVLYIGLFFKMGVAFLLLYSVVRYSYAESQAYDIMHLELLQAQRHESDRLDAAVRMRSEALRKAAVDADEASRAKSELLARVGHDLRAPLSTIMAYAQRLEALGGDVQLRAQAIRHSAREQLALINGLIEYARASAQPDAVLTQPLYLEAWLRSVVARAEGLIKQQGGTLDFIIKGSLPTIVVLDPKRARQILELMIAHAAQRIVQGRIEFQVESVPTQMANGDQGSITLVFTVRDDGPALTAEQIATMFQPFFRLGLGQMHQEVGLGLAVAHQWAARMGARLQVLHTSGPGASLRLTLPVMQGLEADIAPRHLQRRETQLPALNGNGVHIWVVEDSSAVRDLLAAELTGLGFELTIMTNGREALDRLRNFRELAPDLLLTDLSMPGADGLTLQRSVHARWPGLPVVLLTSAPEVVAHQKHGFDAVLAKPVSLVELRHVLANQLNLPLIMAPKPETEQ